MLLLRQKEWDEPMKQVCPSVEGTKDNRKKARVEI